MATKSSDNPFPGSFGKVSERCSRTTNVPAKAGVIKRLRNQGKDLPPQSKRNTIPNIDLVLVEAADPADRGRGLRSLPVTGCRSEVFPASLSWEASGIQK
ncbi:hypothetical protein ZHAS_00003455 [Anopheles sinensis]|uniref:Uncharacterized protein n=1 Tax=Anopheles sinensis TaxID=74873 RepID=A0A084VED7_ANOSI|nr:hypothetical protein ZHAS_00003455 [Anopheles sinensis]